MSTLSKSSSFLRGALMLTAALGCGAVVMSAQTTSDADNKTPLTLSTTLPAYSSSADQNDAPPANVNLAMNAKPFSFLNAMQYGSGSRSGAPRYRGGNSNADGSNKWMWFAGGGMQIPAGNTGNYFNPSWAFQAGFGRQWSKKFAVPLQFDYDNAGMGASTLRNQLALYTTASNEYNAAHPTCTSTSATNPCAVAPSSLGGSMHIWSFTLDPTETFAQSDSWGMYAVEGFGFYHKVSDFTTPTTGIYFDPFYGPIPYTANSVIDHYTSNAVGFNAGLGFTYKFSKFSNERFYAEARYVFVDNSQRAGMTAATIGNNPNNYLIANDFPANSERTGFFPVKVGLRF